MVENESDLLASVDIIAFSYSQQVSQHWDCPRISDRAEKAEEARIWRMVVPEARIEEKAVARGHVIFLRAKQYIWVKKGTPLYKFHAVKSGRLMQSSAFRAEGDTVLLGMRKPNLYDGNNLPLKVLYSKSRRINQHTLSVMLPHLEQSKDKILTWMMRRSTHSLTSDLAPKASDTLVDYYLKVPQATNYHPRVFKHACFTAGDLIAWLALAMELHWKSSGDAGLFTLLSNFCVLFSPISASTWE